LGKVDLEDALCSKTRIKILKVLMRLGQLNTSQIARRVGGNYGSVRRHLDVLEGEASWKWHSAVLGFAITRFNQRSAKALQGKHYCKLGSSEHRNVTDRMSSY
jgi:hypothetical protein